MTKRTENDRDLELDAMLSPLRKVKPKTKDQESWQHGLVRATSMVGPRSEVPTRQNYSRRVVEWAIAASVGFAAASFFINPKSPIQEETVEVKKVFDIDATEMHLVAKSE